MRMGFENQLYKTWKCSPVESDMPHEIVYTMLEYFLILTINSAAVCSNKSLIAVRLQIIHLSDLVSGGTC